MFVSPIQSILGVVHLGRLPWQPSQAGAFMISSFAFRMLFHAEPRELNHPLIPIDVRPIEY
jgi:hypothetical protein